MDKLDEKAQRKENSQLRTLQMNGWNDGLLPVTGK